MTDADVSRRRRLEPDARREEILECAITMFGQRPYAAVSTSELAQEAGVARGLINHYFGTKRDLYLEVVKRMVGIPAVDSVEPYRGSLRERVEQGVDWLLDSIEAHGATWVAVTGSEGIGDDPEVQHILDAADTDAAERVLMILGMNSGERTEHTRAMVRAYGGMVKAAGREWIQRGTLTRPQVAALLTDCLVTLAQETFPRIAAI
ncbi:TetR/AcrR family transcriptional regulator [Antrihabitans stalactiti]|uniref:TetR/AcrR family transcriptional regulator n=1 Tax=Antrihabitans stalactiti TaxID=2584121 RepID=A0A848K9V5_9NOCA|nr:TetR/AcrR family transcriptional regulator [Antrihabitans stalactiti]NMN93472.1 TetR/AcrR family transcriptional regulator [Antrihabitans stalactiti]